MRLSSFPFRFLAEALLALASLAFGSSLGAQSPPAHHTFAIQGKQFLLDGKPFQIISGEMHYPRVPREYWRDRFRKAHAMGLNTITTYAFWNLHEPHPGVFDFSGQNDLVEYLREAQQEGLFVILRPGPYVCAEWELGGYPSWLLKDPTLVLRSDDPKYQAAAARWLKRLGDEVRPLLLANGGPILAVQVENEYGSFAGADQPANQAYLEAVKQQLIAAGLGDTVLYTANPPNDLTKGSLPELPTVINFGTGDAHKAFARLDALRPDGPRMSGEYWAGWFDKWGEPHHETDGAKEAAEFRWMLEQGYSVSLYMFHGGTTFGWMNGADSHTGKDYHPDTSSYDYNAPLNERGEPTYKFALFQQAIAETTHTTPPPLPAQGPRTAFPVSPTQRTASLWRNLPTPVSNPTPLTFEELGQSFGYVLYRTALRAGDGGTLLLSGMHSYAQIYLDQALVGTLDRRLGVESIDIPTQAKPATLDILVENTGRVNYSKAIRTERAGLTGAASLAGKPLIGWRMYSLPMDSLATLHFQPGPCTGPCFFQATLSVQQPADTYLDTRGLHKGQLWLGTHNLGRFWTSAGPEFTLYAPSPWLHAGANTVTWFDLSGDPADRLATSADPIFGGVKSTRETQ